MRQTGKARDECVAVVIENLKLHATHLLSCPCTCCSKLECDFRRNGRDSKQTESSTAGDDKNERTPIASVSSEIVISESDNQTTAISQEPPRNEV